MASQRYRGKFGGGREGCQMITYYLLIFTYKVPPLIALSKLSTSHSVLEILALLLSVIKSTVSLT